MNRRQIVSYVPWQLWDFGLDRGIALLFVGGLMGLSVLWPGYIAFREQMPLELVPGKLLEVAVAQEVSILVVIAASGIVANDRVGGYYRFLFSKPVRMPAYYALQFLVTLIGTLLVTMILLSAFWILVGWVSPLVPLVMIVATYLALGGTIFFFSTFTRLDWGMLVILWGASALSRMAAAGKDWYDVARWVLPPTHQIDKLRGALFAGTEIDVAGTVWLIGYGLVFFLAGLVVLQRKAIAE
jgi:ABC-type transport system involved in multi-copper enzyme maturation permease subunit